LRRGRRLSLLVAVVVVVVAVPGDRHRVGVDVVAALAASTIEGVDASFLMDTVFSVLLLTVLVITVLVVVIFIRHIVEVTAVVRVQTAL
jgi:hypothetical protein